jgi:hypothetical protein
MIRPARARIGASALQHEPFHEAMNAVWSHQPVTRSIKETLDRIKKRTVASQWFRSVHGALNTIPGYAAMHMLRKGKIRWLQKKDIAGQLRFVNRLFGLAARSSRPHVYSCLLDRICDTTLEVTHRRGAMGRVQAGTSA